MVDEVTPIRPAAIEGPAAEAGPPTAHIHDPAALRLPQNFDNVPTDRVITSIKVGRPGKQDFFRTHPSGAFQGNFGLLFLEDDRDEVYVIAPVLHAEMTALMRRMTLVATVNRYGSIKLWPIGLPDPGTGKDNVWFSSARAVASIAQTSWVRLVNARDHYDCVKAVKRYDDPEWPKMSFDEMIQLAFRDGVISDMDHHVVKKLWGEV